MTWARIDDGFHAHPKIAPLSLAARGLFVTALSYSARYMTDGAVPGDVLRVWTRGHEGRRALRQLLEIGLLADVPPAYLIHDYLDFNPSRAELAKAREKERRKKSLQRDTKLRQLVRERDSDHCRYCEAEVNWHDRRGSSGGTYDHVDPRGDESLENVVVACRRCNSSKGHRTPGEAKMPLLAARGAQMDLGPTQKKTRVRGMGVGGATESSNGDQRELPAKVDEVLGLLYAVPRFHSHANEVEDPARVANFMSRFQSADPLEAAADAADWGRSATWEMDDGVTSFAVAMRKQVERAAARQADGKVEPSTQNAAAYHDKRKCPDCGSPDGDPQSAGRCARCWPAFEQRTLGGAVA